MPYTVWGLALAQALLTTGNILLVAVSALIGKQLASHPALVTAPVASQFLGLILATLPAAFLMQKLGRKKVFIIGNVFGIIGAAVAIQALLISSLLLFTLGIFLTGIAIGIAQQYRFAALDECAKDVHPKAISVVMSGGVLAAFIGPNLAIWSQQWFAQNVYVGAFVGLAGLYVLALILIIVLPLKSNTVNAAAAQTDVRSYGALFQQPLLVAATVSGAIGYGVMVFLMTATPLAMHHHDYAFPDIAVVIQWHVLGMFVPSFFTGHLIKRHGLKPIILLGCALLIISAIINLFGQSYYHFFTALLLLGVGWNFTFIGATQLVSLAYRPQEKGKVQGMNDFLVFSTAAVASLFAGQTVETIGWMWVNLISLPLVAMAMLLIAKSRTQA
ncbi:MFS transporter [Vitreoscilla massiliensis]|uniref:MFS transporter n=1 Tax=Vitreoscilla massiliensis TaxID=1689272 RepID=A0ABY4E487_9NEIS|nr:MFS transporter [Vitreoscilla massiliensis]UOO90317.1 MFS transporter [Vitreoscilla massiliensis]